MPKVWIAVTYDNYLFEESATPSPTREYAELTDEELAAWRKAAAEYEAWQAIINDRVKEDV